MLKPSLPPSKNWLVTGGAGFIGSHLCERLLASGHRVSSVDNFNDFYDPAVKQENIAAVKRHPNGDSFQSLAADIRDSQEIDKIFDAVRPDGVIHLAAMPGVGPSIRRAPLYTEVNITGTQIILEACVRYGASSFVFASSSSVYGNNRKIPFSEEDSVDHPISPYAATKKAGELLCHTYAHIFRLRAACLRFFTAYGPRQRPDLAIHKFARLILEGKEIPFYGEGQTSRDYTYIDDLIDGVVTAAAWLAGGDAAGPVYEIFNLGEARTVPLGEMVSCLEKALGKKAFLKKLPLPTGDMVATRADISKAKRVLGYDPKTPFEEGIAKFAEWVRQKECMPV